MPERFGFDDFRSGVREDTLHLYRSFPREHRAAGREPSYRFDDRNGYQAEIHLPLLHPEDGEPFDLEIDVDSDRYGRTSVEYFYPEDEILPWDIEAMVEGGGLYSFLGLFNDVRH